MGASLSCANGCAPWYVRGNYGAGRTSGVSSGDDLLADGRETHIELTHLKAALAVWAYCEASAKYIFGSTLGDPMADDILRALKRAGADGMSRNDASITTYSSETRTETKSAQRWRCCCGRVWLGVRSGPAGTTPD